MCIWWLCCPPGGRQNKAKVNDSLMVEALDPQSQQDYEDLQHLARKREIKVTIRKSTQAGVAAGLSVMAGVIVAGPVGAVVGGALGTAMAVSIAKDVVSLNDLLESTPPSERRAVIQAFNESFREEFLDTIQKSPELKLLLGGGTIFGVLRYMVDRNLLHNKQLERLDAIMRKVA